MDINELKKDVEAFGKGIEKLEKLKAEFKKINISGHKDEAKEIENMLKNVSAIPKLEIKIANLRDAVKNKEILKQKPALIEKYELKTEKEVSENELYQKPEQKEKEIRNAVEEQFSRKLSDKERQIKQNLKDVYSMKFIETERQIRKEQEEEFSRKLSDKESEIRKELEDEFAKKLAEKESQLKQHAQEEIEEKKHEHKEEVED